jgi:hypothetical protein
MREAWFFTRHEVINLLYLPYTGMVLSYVVIGAMTAPVLYIDRLGAALLAYFLGLGVGAHFLNEADGRHAQTGLSPRALWAIGLAALAGATGIGLYYALSVTLWLLPLIAAQVFFVLAYNVTRIGGTRFRGDAWFAVSWAALPFVTSHYLQTQTLTWGTGLLALALALTAAIQAGLSRWLKSWRRGPPLAGLVLRATPVPIPYTTGELIERPERALRLVALLVVVLALAFVVARAGS